MRLRLAASAAMSLLILFPVTAQAQQPWIDAGRQAMIQHYNNLIEQQSTPEQEDRVEEVRRDRDSRATPKAAEDERCDIGAVREKLRSEYGDRVHADGVDAAQEWLRVKAAEAGRYAAENC